MGESDAPSGAGRRERLTPGGAAGRGLDLALAGTGQGRVLVGKEGSRGRRVRIKITGL